MLLKLNLPFDLIHKNLNFSGQIILLGSLQKSKYILSILPKYLNGHVFQSTLPIVNEVHFSIYQSIIGYYGPMKHK